MYEGFTARDIDVGPVRIHCKVAGDGPPLLLLHGYPQTHALWARVAPLLAAHYTVVCADLRGYGASSKPEGAPDHANYSFRAMAADQVALMRALGHERFHVVGHDRGGRTAHRMALDHPQRLLSLAVLDIVPTHVMFAQVDRHIARSYWHWYFLQQPAPYPERLIAANPDHFYEGCLVGWGATRLEDFDPEQLAAYRASWHDPASIHGSCCDYRAGGSIDFDLDAQDLDRRVACPALVFWGAGGQVHRMFDVREAWSTRLERMATATLPGGHFFIDQYPRETAAILQRWLADATAGRIAAEYAA